MEAVSLWSGLRDGLSQVIDEGLGLWAWLKEKVDLAHYKPQAALGMVVSHLTGREGKYHILKNPVSKTYYRLSERDYFLWQLMDGTQTVKDLVVAYFLQYGSFAFARVGTLVQGLKASLFLTEQPVNVYQQVHGQLQRRRTGQRLAQVLQAFLQTQFAFAGLDRLLARTYRWGGWLLYTWPLQILYVIVSAVGLYLFTQILNEGTYSLTMVAGSYGLGIIALIVVTLSAILAHEAAHAMTVKHYGREVRRGGFMLYFGMPAFFVDTTDIWLEGKRPRLAVSWAGPYSGLILGGLASISLRLWPGFVLNPMLFRFAFISYILTYSNLNPLLQLDGYYVLMDWLEIPMLRRKALDFIKSGLWDKLKERRAGKESLWSTIRSFSREEVIFAVFGLLSAVWTTYTIFMGGYFWQARLAGTIRELWTRGGSAGKIIMGLAAAVVSLSFVLAIALFFLGQARKAIAWAAQRGVFASTWNVAGMLLVVTVVLAGVPFYLDHSLVLPIVSLLALTTAVAFAWQDAEDYAGSRLAPVFRLLGLSALAWLLQEVGNGAVALHLLSPNILGPLTLALAHLAPAFLLLAGLLLFADTKLKQPSLLGKTVWALGLVVSYGLVLITARERLTASLADAEVLLVVSSSLFPCLALTLMIPTLFSFWRTRFSPAWITLSAACCGFVVVSLLSLPPAFPYLLLAAGLILHHLAYGQIAVRKDRPETTLGLSDQLRLQRAFSWTVASVTGQLREMSGEGHTSVLIDRFNNYALVAGWRVSIVEDRVGDSLPEGMSLIERGEILASALTLLLDLVAEDVGEKTSARALQRAYDGLHWEEREIAAQYLFRQVERAQSLSQEFRITHQDHRALLRRMPLFATMEEVEIDLLCSRLETETFSAGKVIIRQGQRGDKFYIIKRGHVEVTVRDDRGVTEVVNQLDRGDYFGELALLWDAPRNATCRATLPTEVLVLSRDDFAGLVKGRFALREKVDRSVAQVELLRKIPLFAELDAQQIQLVAAQLTKETYPSGEVIIRQGEIGETFYIIESGRVQISVAHNGVEEVVAERGPGEYVGEIALLLKVRRTATVRTFEPTQALTLRKDDFDQLVTKHLYVNRALERETSRRMIDLRRSAPLG